MDFAAIDFETANEESSSACQLGVVIVRGGREVASRCWMIRPRPMRFSPHCIAVHGITPGQVAGEAEFRELWDEIWQTLSGNVLVAHNAGFDLAVLRSCLRQNELAIPDMQFTCTRSIARQAWPNHSGFGLRAIADRLGIEFRHHDALEDARACAEVLLAAADKWGESSLEKLEKRLHLSRGRAGEWGCGGPRRTDIKRTDYGWSRASYSRGRNRGDRYGKSQSYVYQQRLAFHAGSWDVTAAASNDQQAVKDLSNWQQQARELAGFTGKKVVLTGHLTKLDRELAESLIEMAGGKVCSGVSRKTDVLVVGKPDERTLKAGRTVSTKEEKAKQLKQEGCNILVMDELAFMSQLLGKEQAINTNNE